MRARRSARGASCFEETGYRVGRLDNPLMRRVKDGVDFTTFICDVEGEFVPHLNQEHSAWAWLDPREVLEDVDGAKEAG